MKGLIVKSKIAEREELQKAAVPGSCASVLVGIIQNEGAFWHVGGCIMPEEIYLRWNNGDLSVGDEIEIEVADIDEATPYQREDTFTCMMESSEEKDDESVWQRKLERYYRLKAILEKEKLIDEKS